MQPFAAHPHPSGCAEYRCQVNARAAPISLSCLIIPQLLRMRLSYMQPKGLVCTDTNKPTGTHAVPTNARVMLHSSLRMCLMTGAASNTSSRVCVMSKLYKHVLFLGTEPEGKTIRRPKYVMTGFVLVLHLPACMKCTSTVPHLGIFALNCYHSYSHTRSRVYG